MNFVISFEKKLISTIDSTRPGAKSSPIMKLDESCGVLTVGS